MREIKFKIWDPEFKMMAGSYSLLDIASGDIDSREDLVFLQYIGMKDENDKEVYEGDVIGYRRGNKDKILEVKSELTRSCGCCSVVFGWELMESERDIEEVTGKIIGNIYENPELKELIT